MPLACSMPLRASANSATAAVTTLVVGLLHRRCDVDVEAVRADHLAGVVEELVADHHDLMHLASGVEDAMPGGKCAGGAADLVQRGRHLAVVVGMLVR